MPTLANIVFPLYKLRSYYSIDKNPLGLIKVTSIRGTYVLDDTSINGTFEERRAILSSKYPKEKIYTLKERVLYLRHLVKYKSGTSFIDHNGRLFKYQKGHNLFEVKSHKITLKREYDNWTILHLEGLEQTFIIAVTLVPTVTHASIMHTKWGPFLYDITNKEHEVYRRKI